MAYTYYKEVFANGRWMLFRATDGQTDEVFNVELGWIKTELLFRRRNKGDIDDADIVSEVEADRLISTFPPPG